MPQAPNHPPAPVQEGVNPAIPLSGKCDALKEEFGIKSNTHAKNTRGADKGTSKALGLQSHHVLQDAQTDQIISRGKAIAVVLQDSHGGSEHGTITARQNTRMSNKGGAGGPAGTFGALKKEAEADLVAGLEGKRTSKKTGKPMTKKQAKAVAKCLVDEAEEAAKSEWDKNKVDDDAPDLTDETEVQPPGDCLNAGTLVWLADGAARTVEELAPGDEVWTPEGPLSIVRIDLCRHERVGLSLGAETLIITSNHRLLNVAGEWRRADQHQVGDRLQTLAGPVGIRARRMMPAIATYRLCFSRPTVAAVGMHGIWARMPESAVPVVRTETIALGKGAAECPSP